MLSRWEIWWINKWSSPLANQAFLKELLHNNTCWHLLSVTMWHALSQVCLSLYLPNHPKIWGNWGSGQVTYSSTQLNEQWSWHLSPRCRTTKLESLTECFFIILVIIMKVINGYITHIYIKSQVYLYVENIVNYFLFCILYLSFVLFPLRTDLLWYTNEHLPNLSVRVTYILLICNN